MKFNFIVVVGFSCRQSLNMHSSFEFNSSPSLTRNTQTPLPSGNASFVSTASHQLTPEIDGIRNYVSFFRDKSRTSKPRIRVSYSSTPQMVLTPFSDFQPLQVSGASRAGAPEVKEDSNTDTDDDGHLIQKVSSFECTDTPLSRDFR